MKCPRCGDSTAYVYGNKTRGHNPVCVKCGRNNSAKEYEIKTVKTGEFSGGRKER